MLILLTGLFALVVVFGTAAVLHEASDLVVHLRRSRASTMRRPSFTDIYRLHSGAPRWREVVGRVAEQRRVAIMLAAQADSQPAPSHRELARYGPPISA